MTPTPTVCCDSCRTMMQDFAGSTKLGSIYATCSNEHCPCHQKNPMEGWRSEIESGAFSIGGQADPQHVVDLEWTIDLIRSTLHSQREELRKKVEGMLRFDLGDTVDTSDGFHGKITAKEKGKIKVRRNTSISGIQFFWYLPSELTITPHLGIENCGYNQALSDVLKLLGGEGDVTK